MPVDESDLGDRRLERARAHPVLDPLGLAEESSDLAPSVGREVAPDAGPEVGGLPDVEDFATMAAEEVDARRPGEGVGEGQLPGIGVAGHRRQDQKVVESGDPECRRPLEEEV